MSAVATPLTYFHKQHPSRLRGAWRLVQTALAQEANAHEVTAHNLAIGGPKRMTNRHRLQEGSVDPSAACALIDEMPCRDTPHHAISHKPIRYERKNLVPSFAYFKLSKLSTFTRNKEALIVMPKMYFYS